jgi:hypothetical protein
MAQAHTLRVSGRSITRLGALTAIAAGPACAPPRPAQPAPVEPVMALHDAAPEPAPAPPFLDLPPRDRFAIAGSEFIRMTEGLAVEQREDAILREIMEGNIPDFLRNLRPVTLRRPGSDAVATIWVLPDYLAIGGNDDYVRIPMTLVTATRIARALDFVLPTQKVVNAVYDQAEVHLTPHPLPPTGAMRSNGYYLAHDRLIRAELGPRSPGMLVAGHKKDVVISKLLRTKPGSLVIYGWHQARNMPIQPLSDAHGAFYVDYSHGIRLVADSMQIDGAERSFTDVVADAQLSDFVSSEGPIDHYGDLMENLRLAQWARAAAL